MTIELVPATCFGSNLRNALPRRGWDVMRRRVYRAAGNRCEVCGGQGTRHRVECHEVWEYDDRDHVQRLVRLVALCPACHGVKHIALTSHHGRTAEALEHLASVNDWTLKQADSYAKKALAEWRERSTHLWSLDLEKLRDYGLDPDSVDMKPRAGRATRSREVIAKQPSGREKSAVGSGPQFDPDSGQDFFWTCEDCGRRGSAVVAMTGAADEPPGLRAFLADQLRAPHLTEVREIRLPEGWTRRGGGVLCSRCASAE